MGGLMADKFNRRERGYLDVLQRRLDYLREQEGDELRTDLSYVAGERMALAWAVATLTGATDDAELRFTRIEQTLRLVQSRLSIVERELEVDE